MIPWAATGIGSMPGTNADEQSRIVAGELPDWPHVVELPARGPGSDIVGRTLGQMSKVAQDFAVATTPSGWRLTDGRGREMRRSASWLAEDCDAAERHYAGVGNIKISLCGPWTLAAAIEMRNGERAIRDHGFCHDVVAALRATSIDLIADLQRRLPATTIWLQFDEPSLPAVLAARIKTASGMATYRAVDAPRVAESLQSLTAAVKQSQAKSMIHGCASDSPLDLFRRSNFDALSVDVTTSSGVSHDAMSAVLDEGRGLVLGLPNELGSSAKAKRLTELLGEFGFVADEVAQRVGLSPTCGLANQTDIAVRQILGSLRTAGSHLRDDDPALSESAQEDRAR